MLIAVDHGNYSIKTPNFSFVAGLAEHTVPPPILDDCIEYAGRYWTLSESRIFYMRDKTQDDRYFILTLFAIAKELEKKRYTSPVVSVDLAVGLPPEHYGVLKDRFAAYFKRNKPVRFSYKGKQIMLSINRVLVFPQAYAAVALDSSSTIGYSRLFLIDIGGYTTDVLLLRSGKPDLQYCRSLECGIITMNNEIIRKINTLHDLHIDDEHISAVLLGEDTILPMDAQDTIRSATKVHAGNILNQLRELQFSSLKNDKIRVLTVATDVMDALRKQQRLQKQWALEAGSLWDNSSNLVFTNELGRYINNKTLYMNFKKVMASVGLTSLRFHDLRHTYAVNSLKAGDDIKTVQENLGHATASFTLSTYAHATPGMKRESANRMEQFIKSLNAES